MTTTQAFFIAIFSILFASFGQILLKREDLRLERSFLQKYLNLFIPLGYVFLFLSFLGMTIALIKLPLTYILLFGGLEAVLSSALHSYFLDEEMEKRRVLGIAFVVIGMVLFLLPRTL